MTNDNFLVFRPGSTFLVRDCYEGDRFVVYAGGISKAYTRRMRVILKNTKPTTKTMTKTLIFLFLATVFGLTISCNNQTYAQNEKQDKPKISFTFDDGQVNDFGKYKLKAWNQLLLDNLKKHNLKAILFSSGANKSFEKGKYVLSSWNDAGHLIANHTYSHPNFNNKMVSLKNFEFELIRNDTIIN